MILAGPHEFIDPDEGSKVSMRVLRVLVEAYELMPYDLGKLSPLEVRQLGRQATPIPDYWITTNDKVQTRIIEKGGQRIGLVISPVDQEQERPPATLLRQEFIETGRKLRPEVDFMIGLLAWGNKWERRFIDEFQGVFDVVLGGGKGPGQQAIFSRDRSVVLTRPSPEAKTVNRLDIPNWNERDATAPTPVIAGTRAQMIRLTDRFREHTDVRRQLQKLD